MADSTTRSRILDTAESLFAEQGFSATSLRNITTAAGVNLAAVNYHFRSKEGLIEAVFARRVAPLNAERLELLTAAEDRAAAEGRKPPIEEVVRALVAPALKLRQHPNGPAILKLISRTFIAPTDTIRPILFQQFSEVAQRFIAALGAALPDLSDEDRFWRLHFAIGAMAHALADTSRLEFISGGLCDACDIPETTARLISFIVGGMSVPPANSKPSARRRQKASSKEPK